MLTPERPPAAASFREGCIMTDPQWQPIETAPRGPFVLLYVPDAQLETGPVTIGRWWPPIEPRDERGRFAKGKFEPADWHGWLGTDGDNLPSWCDPTHWRPLPDPPEAS